MNRDLNNLEEFFSSFFNSYPQTKKTKVNKIKKPLKLQLKLKS